MLTAPNKNGGDDRNLFRHIPLNSRLIENMNMSLFKDITNRQEDFMRAFNAGNAAGAADVYDPEGYFMPTANKPIKGRAGIKEYFEKDMAEGVKSVQIITEEVLHWIQRNRGSVYDVKKLILALKEDDQVLP